MRDAKRYSDRAASRFDTRDVEVIDEVFVKGLAPGRGIGIRVKEPYLIWEPNQVDRSEKTQTKRRKKKE